MSMTDYLLERFGATMTPLDVAGVLRCHPSHVRAMCARGDLPAIQIGKRWHVVTCRFARMLEGGKLE